MASESATKFADIVNEYSYISHIGKKSAPHINVTFFLGAGFSKSWDEKYPLADKLFSFKEDQLWQFFRGVSTIFYESGLDVFDDVTPNILKDIIYHLNMELKYPSIRSRYLDENSIRTALNQIKSSIVKNFIEEVNIDYADTESLLIHLPTDIDDRKTEILKFFHDVAYHEDGSRGYPSGVRINFITTNYDFLIETILDNISGSSDEPHFLYTYRGITPTAISGEPNPSVIHSHTMVHTLIKINGGLEILCNQDGTYNLEYRERDIEEIYKSPPVIMMPSREQDYHDDYFSSIFPKAVRLLHESKVLVVVGYSFPEDDALLRFLLRQFAEDYRDVKDKYIFYVDHMERNKQIDRLSKCFPHLAKERQKNMYPFSGDYVDWAKEVRENLRQNVDKALYEEYTKKHRVWGRPLHLQF